MYDAIILGAGMSGLAAGIRLAYYQRRVAILERHGTVGGLNSFYQRRGRIHDVGLHAVTNYASADARLGPLARALRQLRIARGDLDLAPQLGSAIAFPGVTLQFSNDLGLLESEIARHFRREQDNFRRLVASLAPYDQFGQAQTLRSARQAVGSLIGDPLLVEMLMCPVLFYGGAREHDMDFGQFSILFRSVFLEGLGRPFAGIRQILDRLTGKFLELGGELRLRSPAARIIANAGRVEGVVLEDGTELPARSVISSAGWPETLRLCDRISPLPPGEGQGVRGLSSGKCGSHSAADFAPPRPPGGQPPAGGQSIVESISVLNAQPRSLGCDRTIVFYNDSEKFHYREPREPVDLRSGIVCSPNNFAYPQSLPEGILRVSALASYDRWAEMDRDTYARQKREWYDRLVEAAARFVPDFRGAVVDADLFTPVTIRRFTGHDRGAIYGAVEKRCDGTTHLANLYLAGNDQGLVGIVGAMLSGIGIVNRYLLKSGPVASATETQ
ncbi:MAG: NAD(P)/FAD-dependent oxidoreductase [Thermoguttaceae bacterium]|jgi:phytoene dehydrogenase-like protein